LAIAKSSNEIGFHYNIRSQLQASPEGPASLGAKFVDTLDALSRINPLFVDWRVFDCRGRALQPLAQARSHIGTIIEGNVVRDDLGKASPESGYHAIGSAGKFKDPKSVNFLVEAGGKVEGEAVFELGEWDVVPDPSIVTYSIFKETMLTINAVWSPPWACAYAFRIDYFEIPLSPDAPLFPYSRFHIPWIAYLSANLATDLKLPPEIQTERTADGGLLMIAATERLDPTNPEHLRRARILAETLIARTGLASKSRHSS
jgi:hypothetical protein